MAWPIDFDPAHPEGAIDWMRARVPMTRADWDALTVAAREKAFMVSGVAQLDLITQAWEAVDAAIATGTTLRDFKKTIGASLEAAWAGTVDHPAWRIETIFRTNVQLAYSRGRHEQMTDPAVLEGRPYWLYDAVNDRRTTKVCRACDGKVLPASDPWWTTHTPPLHFGCRSSITPLTAEEAHEMGVAPHPPAIDADEGFGNAPGAAPEWTPSKGDYPEQLWLKYEQKTADVPVVAPKPRAPTPRS